MAGALLSPRARDGYENRVAVVLDGSGCDGMDVAFDKFAGEYVWAVVLFLLDTSQLGLVVADLIDRLTAMRYDAMRHRIWIGCVAIR